MSIQQFTKVFINHMISMFIPEAKLQNKTMTPKVWNTLSDMSLQHIDKPLCVYRLGDQLLQWTSVIQVLTCPNLKLILLFLEITYNNFIKK